MPADSIERRLRGSFYQNNRLTFIMVGIGSLMGSAFNLALSWLMQQLIDAAAGAPGTLPFGSLVQISGAIFLLYLCNTAILYASKPRFLTKAMEQYKNSSFALLLQKAVPDFRQQSSAVYLSGMTNDAAILETDYLTNQFSLITKLCCGAGALGLMLTYSLPLTLAAAILAQLPLVVSLAAGNRLSAAVCRVSDCSRDFTAFLSDCLSGFPVIRSFHAQAEMAQRFAAENHRLEQQKCSRLKLQHLLDSIGAFAGMAAQLGVFLIGTWLTLTGRGVTPGIVIAFVNLMNFLIEPVAALPGLLASSKAALALVQKMAGNFAADTPQQGKKNLQGFTGQITLKQVSYAYGQGKPVLDNLSFTLQAGRAYAVVGASGSGKSTLLRLLQAPDAGRKGQVLFDDIDIGELSPECLNNLISVIQQEVFVFNASIRDNITMFHPFPEETVAEVVRRAHLQELVARCGLDALCGEGGCQLSGGEKQRIAIARSLLKQASVLLADEATAALDARMAHEITQDILTLTGMTRVVVTHRLEASLLQQYDAILVLRDGRIAEAGPFTDLLQRGGYFSAMYKLAQ